jgi:hypothetical protein
MSRETIETNAETLLPIMERDYKARLKAVEARLHKAENLLARIYQMPGVSMHVVDSIRTYMKESQS